MGKKRKFSESAEVINLADEDLGDDKPVNENFVGLRSTAHAHFIERGIVRGPDRRQSIGEQNREKSEAGNRTFVCRLSACRDQQVVLEMCCARMQTLPGRKPPTIKNPCSCDGVSPPFGRAEGFCERYLNRSKFAGRKSQPEGNPSRYREPGDSIQESEDSAANTHRHCDHHWQDQIPR